MLQSLGTIAIAATVAAVILVVSTSLFERPGERLLASVIAGAWVGVAVALPASGVFRGARGLPVFGLLFAVPFVIAALCAIVVPGARSRLPAIPRRTIVAVNILRTIGALFVALALVGQLSGPFPWVAGVGDVVVGLGAIALLFDEHRIARNDARLVLWNVLGVVDLFAAVVLGLTSASGSPLQLFHVGVGSAAITTLPWSLVPTFLVPCYLIGHAIVFAQMRVSRRSAHAFQPLAATRDESLPD